MTWAGVSFFGVMLPLIAVTRWPGEIILFLLLTVGVGVPLGLYVLLIRTRIAALATGIVLAAAGLVVPLPGYPQFLRGVAGSWGYVLLLMPAVLFGIWLLGWVADLLVRADQKLGDPGRPPVPGTALVLSTVPRPAVARGVASVVSPRAIEAGPSGVSGDPSSMPATSGGSTTRPGIRVEYRQPPEPPADAQGVIDGSVVHRSDHPLD